jgi:hypothetical protein
LAAFTPYTITDGARLRRVLAEVRRTGVAVSSRQVTEDALSVAAPVRGPGGAVVAAVSVVVPQAGAQVPVLTPAVRVAARGISRALGWQPDEASTPRAGRGSVNSRSGGGSGSGSGSLIPGRSALPASRPTPLSAPPP